MAISHGKQGLLCDKIVSPFVHIFAIISLVAAELKEPRIGIWGKGWTSDTDFQSLDLFN